MTISCGKTRPNSELCSLLDHFDQLNLFIFDVKTRPNSGLCSLLGHFDQLTIFPLSIAGHFDQLIANEMMIRSMILIANVGWHVLTAL